MSQLHPGGFRGRMGDFTGRIFGFENIRRALQKRGKTYRFDGSIALGNRHGGPHYHEREIARHIRQGASVNA